jgi:hypothetical protein
MAGRGRLSRWAAGLAAAAVAALPGPAAQASGPAGVAPWYLDQFGGDPPDMRAFYAGRVGIVMPTAPRAMLFISWRLLHGQAVGQTAGEALSQPCCGTPWWAEDFTKGQQGWNRALEAVLGPPAPNNPSRYVYRATDKELPNHQYAENCFAEAFDVATATLKDRVARYGAGSADVRAWLAGQDAVFKACHDQGVTLPPLPAGPPAWLVRDRAYQAAALALYAWRNDDAAAGFEAIGRDAASPWRASGPYLAVRARLREALQAPTPASYAKAHAALAALAASPEGTFGRGQVAAMTNVLEVREHPQAFLTRISAALARPEPYPQIAVDFRDFVQLGEAATTKPEALDWIDTMKWVEPPLDTVAARAGGALEAARASRLAAQGHAAERWRSDRDPAWLIAALSLTSPGDPAAAELARAGEAVPAASPAWISVQHHLVRLSLRTAPAADSRRRLDALLARADLSVSDRNIFTALRAQVAADLDDFIRHALRQRLCAGSERWWAEDPAKRRMPTCARDRWMLDEVQPSGVYDGEHDTGTTGFGDDARAIVDRAPLALRIAIARDARLPAALRLDVAATSYARAVQLQDAAAIDGLSRDLATLLPLMARDFRAVPAAKPGPDKRFAEFLVLAKIPGVRTDLIDPYRRPEGKRIEDFQEHWPDWAMVRAPVAGAAPPPLAAYQAEGYGAQASGAYGGVTTPDAETDLSCLGECGAGAAPLRLPDFIAAGQAQARRERGFFLAFEERFDNRPRTYPTGAVSVWDEMLDWCRTHPADPRTPEALHWLVHVGHFGGSHNHSGRRAFRLLHARYGGGYWAKRTPYYND